MDEAMDMRFDMVAQGKAHIHGFIHGVAAS